MAHGNRTLHGAGRNTFAGDGELHVNFGKYLGIHLGTLGGQLDGAALHIVAAALQNQHHVIGGAAAGASQHGFQGAGRQVLAAVFGLGCIRCTVHHQRMAAAGFGHKAHARAGVEAAGPTDCAFHGLSFASPARGNS